MSFEESDLDFTVIQYENELSKASDIEDVQMLNTYGNNALNYLHSKIVILIVSLSFTSFIIPLIYILR